MEYKMDKLSLIGVLGKRRVIEDRENLKDLMSKFSKPYGPIRREIEVYDFDFFESFNNNIKKKKKIYCDVDDTLFGDENIFYWVNADGSIDEMRFYILEDGEKVEVYHLPMCIDPYVDPKDFFTLINNKYVPSETLTFTDGYFYSNELKVGTAINYVYSKSTYDEYYENMKKNKKSRDGLTDEDAILQK